MFPGAKWDQSPLFKKIYEAEFGQLGSQPFGALIGDFYFDHSSSDVRLLRDLGKIAASAHAPFISAAAPTLLGMDSWNELGNPRDLSTVFDTPDYAGWNSLRDNENSRYLAITLPRILSRSPYGQNGEPVDEFNFEEATDGHEGKHYAWMNAAHAMAVNIGRAHKEYGWTVQIRGVQSGGEVTNLPVHNFDTGDGSTDMKCDRVRHQDHGVRASFPNRALSALIHRKNTDRAAAIGAQTLYQRRVSGRTGDRLGQRLVAPALHLRRVALQPLSEVHGARHDRVEQGTTSFSASGGTGSAAMFTAPANASNVTRHFCLWRRPRLEVIADEENPGYYVGKFFLRPHFQLEGMDIGMNFGFQASGREITATPGAVQGANQLT